MNQHTAIRYEELGRTVALTDLNTGELVINPRIWPRLPAWARRFILLHEQGHLVHGNADEGAANDYAVKMYIDRSSPQRLMDTLAMFDQAMSFAQDHGRAPVPESALQGATGAAFFMEIVGIFTDYFTGQDQAQAEALQAEDSRLTGLYRSARNWSQQLISGEIAGDRLARAAFIAILALAVIFLLIYLKRTA